MSSSIHERRRPPGARDDADVTCGLPQHVVDALTPLELAVARRADVVALALDERVRYLRQERGFRRLILVISGLFRSLLLVGGGIAALGFAAFPSLRGLADLGSRAFAAALGIALVLVGAILVRGVRRALAEIAGAIPDP